MIYYMESCFFFKVAISRQKIWDNFTLENHHSTFYLYEFNYSKYLYEI